MANEPLTPSAAASADASAFLVSWMIEQLNKQGLIDGRQLETDLLSLIHHPQMDAPTAEAYETTLNEMRLLGIVSMDDEQPQRATPGAGEPVA